MRGVDAASPGSEAATHEDAERRGGSRGAQTELRCVGEEHLRDALEDDSALLVDAPGHLVAFFRGEGEGLGALVGEGVDDQGLGVFLVDRVGRRHAAAAGGLDRDLVALRDDLGALRERLRVDLRGWIDALCAHALPMAFQLGRSAPTTRDGGGEGYDEDELAHGASAQTIVGRPRCDKQVAVVAVYQDPFGLTGTVLEGQYRVDRIVGEGGFGVVYRGHHLSLDQPIAIKVLKGLDGGDPTINGLILEKFRAEARLLYTLSQSSLNIVRSLHFSAITTPTGAWAPFMVLEWLDGRSLADDLTARAARGAAGRSVAEAMPILAGIAEGLATAHRQQVVHRDIKPANVFLLPETGTEGPKVKVLDFGIAKIMKEGEAAGTKGTFASFTWLYAAPEQLDPRLGPTGLTTDVYAFALLITEILTGNAPIDDNDVVGIMRTAMDPTRRPTPRNRGANVSDEIEAVCRKALAVNPGERYASIAELWAAFAAAAKTRSATTMQPAISIPGPMSAGVNPMAATGVAGAVPSSGARVAPVTGARPSLPSAAQWTPPPPTPPGFGYGQPPPLQQPPLAWGPPPLHGGPMMQPPWVRRLPIKPPETMSTTAIVTIVAFVVLTMFSASCAACVACIQAAG